MRNLRAFVALAAVAVVCGFYQVSYSGESARGNVEKDFQRYRELADNHDARLSHIKEFKDLFIYFNYGDGSVFRSSARRKAAEPGREIHPASAIQKNRINPVNVADDGLNRVLEQKLREIGVPEPYRRYLSVETWQVNLDQDPFLETIVSVRLSLDIGTGKRTTFGFVCPRKDMAHIIFVVNPARSQQDYENVFTLSVQKHVTDSCDCVGCLAARLVDVYDFDEDGQNEVVIYETIYGMGHYKVYGLRGDGGFVLQSYHPPYLS